MKNNSRIRFLVHFLLWALVSVEVFISTANILALTLNTPEHGYRFSNTQIADITLADGSCKKVTNNNTDRFIPTKTMAEWLSFSSVASFLGVGIASCMENGACNPQFDAYVTPTPTCASGTPTAISGSGPWRWGCNGIGGGTSTAPNACIANKIAAPTCSDGIKNQSEEYVDCGGPNCSACIPKAGVCKNTVVGGCTVGNDYSLANTGCGVGTTTWYCSGKNGGADSPQCSKAQTPCPPPVNGVCNNSVAFGCSAGGLDFASITNGGCGLGTSTWKCLGENGGATSPICSKAQTPCNCSESLDINWGACYYYNPSGTSVAHNVSKTYTDNSPSSMGSLTVKCNNGVFNTVSSICLTCNNNGIKDNGETGVDCGGGGCEACHYCSAGTYYQNAMYCSGACKTAICVVNYSKLEVKEGWVNFSANSTSSVFGSTNIKCGYNAGDGTTYISTSGSCTIKGGATAKDCAGRPDMTYILGGGAHTGPLTGMSCYY